MELETIDERPELVYNFSRPRPQDGNFSGWCQPRPRSVRAVSAFHEPEQHHRQQQQQQQQKEGNIPSAWPLPDEPRFSIDSDSSDDHDSLTGITWNGRGGEFVSKPKPTSLSVHDQRYPRSPSQDSSSISSVPRVSTSGSNRSSSITTTASDSSSSGGGGGSGGGGKPLLRPPKGILKRSVPASPSPVPSEPGEDTRSHHTVSDAGSSEPTTSSSSTTTTATATAASAGATWSSSDYDVSALSEKKRKKLEKKGINPALYLEMKAARTGKGRMIGILTGNTYVN